MALFDISPFLKMIDSILEESRNPPVIVFQADHGFLHIPGDKDFVSLIQFAPYAAYHLPEGHSCIVLDYNGTVSNEQKDELWHRFYTLAPQRQRQPAEKYNIVKRA